MDYFDKQYAPPGTAPGRLDTPAPAGEEPLAISLVEYGPERVTEQRGVSMEVCRHFLDTPEITWIHVQGAAETEVLERLGEEFGLHRLALEDVLHSGQRPKAERYDDQLFVVLALPETREGRMTMPQVSLFMGPNFLVSFYSGGSDPFEPVRLRLRANGTSFRRRGVDYLLYALVDLIIDRGFPLLESLGERIEALELELLDRPDRNTLARIHILKRELILLRRNLWPLREVVNTLLRDDSGAIQHETRIYLRDCYDHAIHILELLETYRDTTASMLDVYLSSVSHRLNEVMRVLTVIATIFIPLTFVVGLYGMNFDRASPWNMPELGWHYGYPAVWGLMIAMVVGMVGYFRWKRWF